MALGEALVKHVRLRASRSPSRRARRRRPEHGETARGRSLHGPRLGFLYSLLTGFNVLASGLVRLLDAGMDFPKTIVDERMRDDGSDKAVRRSRAAYCSLVSFFSSADAAHENVRKPRACSVWLSECENRVPAPYGYQNSLRSPPRTPPMKMSENRAPAP